MKWIICASGPSMRLIDLSHLRRFRSWRVLAVNNTWELMPWAHAMYAGDRQWWDRYGHRVSGFGGERWTRDQLSAQRYRLRLARLRGGSGLCAQPWAVNSGGNSGFQAINLAYHMGMRKGVLLGFDMHRRDGAHWHGEHDSMLSAPQSHIDQWKEAMVPLAHDLAMRGIEVVNATPGTELHAFRKVPLFEALR